MAEHKVVGAEEATKGARSDRVHGSGLEVDEDGTGNVLVRADFVVVDVDTLELEVVVALVQAIAVNPVFV